MGCSHREDPCQHSQIAKRPPHAVGNPGAVEVVLESGVRGTLLELRERGEMSPVDPTVGAFGVLGSVLWVARWFRPGGRLSGSEVADEIAEIALMGLLRKETQ